MDWQAIIERISRYMPRKRYCQDAHRDLNRVFTHRRTHRWNQHTTLLRVVVSGYAPVMVVDLNGEWREELRFTLTEWHRMGA